MTALPLTPATRRRALLPLVALLAACGGAETPAPAADGVVADGDTAARRPALADTALLSADAVAIGGFVLDTARVAPWRSDVALPGRIVTDPARHQALGSITEGRVARVLVQVGDRVRRGELLVAIHSHEIMDARAQLAAATGSRDAARAARATSAAALARAERLYDAKAGSLAELERARSADAEAAARLLAAEAEFTRADGLVHHLLGDGPEPAGNDPHDVLIRAPIDGVVATRDVVAGAVVLPGDPLLSIADPDAMHLEVRVPDRLVGALEPGRPVTFTLVGDVPGASAGAAVVTRIAPAVDTLTRTLLVLARITDAPAGTRAERFATAQLDVGDAREALTVPAEAVQALEGDTVVIVAEQRGAGLHLVARPVSVGRRDATRAEILRGLDAGAIVIGRGAAIARVELLKARAAGGPDA
jgi:cobalt-zinc-cadmium efflux system membrane fusion protein